MEIKLKDKKWKNEDFYLKIGDFEVSIVDDYNAKDKNAQKIEICIPHSSGIMVNTKYIKIEKHYDENKILEIINSYVKDFKNGVDLNKVNTLFY